MSDIWDFLRTGKNTRCGKFRKSCIVQKISSIFAKQMSLPGEPQGSILGGRFQFYSSLIPTRPAMSAVRPSSVRRLRCGTPTADHSTNPSKRKTDDCATLRGRPPAVHFCPLRHQTCRAEESIPAHLPDKSARSAE